MANYFVDSTTGSNGDDGTTMDLAFATLEYAVESGGLSPGDIVWIRRLHNETPVSHIAAAYNATHENPIRVIGWPRAADGSITSATWTGGSTTVDLVVGLSMSRESHLGRFVIGPDNFPYLITRIIDSDTFIIDREYIGSTVIGAGGACTIVPDEHWVADMGTEYGFNDSGWTIKETDWDVDADDLVLIDFAGGSYYVNVGGGNNYHWHNLDFQGGINGSGTIYAPNTSGSPVVQGCLVLKSANAASVNVPANSYLRIDRCIIVGSGSGGSQWGMYGYGQTHFSNGAIYNMGDSALVLQGTPGSYFDNVNLGVEMDNGDDEIYIIYSAVFHSKDMKLGGANGLITVGGPIVSERWRMKFENYNKVLGTHKIFTAQGEITKLDVVEGSGDPYKRTGGADSVIEILHNLSSTTFAAPKPYAMVTPPLFTHQFKVDDTSKNYRYYIQAEGAVAASELWIEIEYVNSYNSTSRYMMGKVISGEAISVRSGPGDWSQYIEINNITPAVASKIRIRCYCSYYHATNKIYVDPKVRVT